MIGKIRKGRSFRGVLNYLFFGNNEAPRRPEDVHLIGGNMVGTNPRELAKEFRYSRSLRPGAKRVVFHLPLSLAEGEYFDDKTWHEAAERHLEYLGYDDNQWTLIRHTDTKCDHVHIVASMINWDGQVVSDSMDYKKNGEGRQILEKVYGLKRAAMTPTEAQAAQRRTPAHPKKEGATPDEEVATKRHLRQILKETVKTSPTITNFIEQLEAKGVRLRPNIAKTGRVSGMSYELDGHTFKGSTLGKGYAWQGLQRLNRIDYDEARDLEPLKLASRKGLPIPEEANRAETKAQLDEAQGTEAQPEQAAEVPQDPPPQPKPGEIGTQQPKVKEHRPETGVEHLQQFPQSEPQQPPKQPQSEETTDQEPTDDMKELVEAFAKLERQAERFRTRENQRIEEEQRQRRFEEPSLAQLSASMDEVQKERAELERKSTTFPGWKGGKDDSNFDDLTNSDDSPWFQPQNTPSPKPPQAARRLPVSQFPETKSQMTINIPQRAVPGLEHLGIYTDGPVGPEVPSTVATPETTEPPTPGKWSRFKARFISSIEEIWARVALMVEKAKNKLKKRRDAQQQTEKAQATPPPPEQTPKSQTQPQSPDLDIWAVDGTDGTDTSDHEPGTMKQYFRGKRPDPHQRQDNGSGSVLSKLSKIRTTPHPWDEGEDDDPDKDDKDKPPPKYRGPVR